MADAVTETPCEEATIVAKTEPEMKTEPTEKEGDTEKVADSETKPLDTVEVKKENGCEEKTENGVKSETDSIVKTAEDNNDPNLESKIVRQIEYYFGDINLPRDKFLQEQIKLEDGWVPIDVMLRFHRLKNLSSKTETIVSCLKSSSTLMEVNEDETKLRRLPSKPLPENTPDYVEDMHGRTVYCKGFPESLDDIDALLNFFEPYGPVENIFMRRRPGDRKTQAKMIFKGSVYVLFKTKELAEKFLALESVTYEGKELIKMTRSAHGDEQKRERDERWGKKVKPSKGDDGKSNPQREFPKGCILKISPLNDESISRDNIKEALVAHGADVAFIQYDKGNAEAIVRLFSVEDGAACKFIKTLEDSGKKLKIVKEVELAPLEGEEEETFLNNTRLAMGRNNQRGQHRKRGGSRGGRGNFRGRSRGHKRSGSPSAGGATPSKKAALSD